MSSILCEQKKEAYIRFGFFFWRFFLASLKHYDKIVRGEGVGPLCFEEYCLFPSTHII